MSEPVFIKVPLLQPGEVGLMGVLDYIVHHFGVTAFPRPLDAEEVGRAVDWLHAKHGTARVTARGGEGEK